MFVILLYFPQIWNLINTSSQQLHPCVRHMLLTIQQTLRADLTTGKFMQSFAGELDSENHPLGHKRTPVEYSHYIPLSYLASMFERRADKMEATGVFDVFGVRNVQLVSSVVVLIATLCFSEVC